MEIEVNEMLDAIKYVEDALYVFGGKWKLQILISMYAGSKRFRDLKNSIPKITSRVLSKELKDLEANKLIERTIVNKSPISIEYSLTEYTNSLQPVITGIVNWGINHRKKIMAQK
jgi:DNA-binding HxlR family transcriptional regulator